MLDSLVLAVYFKFLEKIRMMLNLLFPKFQSNKGGKKWKDEASDEQEIIVSRKKKRLATF